MAFTDWDFVGVTGELDPAVYVSSPSALKVTALATGTFNHVLCKVAGTTALKQGRLITQLRVQSTSNGIGVVFRYQDTNNWYVAWLYPSGTKWYLYLNVAGSITAIGNRALTFSMGAATWYKFRFTFWVSENQLFVRCEYWNGSSWVAQGADLVDTTNKWGATGGKIGPHFEPGSAITSGWFDDTEIWG
jgi:hypothetical protein